MKILKDVTPTPEQLKIISNPQAGVSLIRGAAGSGKTTTAILMLRLLAQFWTRRALRRGAEETTRILVLTFNRTLKGYVSELAASQLSNIEKYSLNITTFGKWSKRTFMSTDIVSDADREYKIKQLGWKLPLDGEFLVNEVDYLMGRFPPATIEEYIDCRRIGRGGAPRVDKILRRRILDEVVAPYFQWLHSNNKTDWNGMAVKMATENNPAKYDIIVVDEAQDFSANQIRIRGQDKGSGRLNRHFDWRAHLSLHE